MRTSSPSSNPSPYFQTIHTYNTSLLSKQRDPSFQPISLKQSNKTQTSIPKEPNTFIVNQFKKHFLLSSPLIANQTKKNQSLSHNYLKTEPQLQTSDELLSQIDRFKLKKVKEFTERKNKNSFKETQQNIISMLNNNKTKRNPNTMYDSLLSNSNETRKHKSILYYNNKNSLEEMKKYNKVLASLQHLKKKI